MFFVFPMIDSILGGILLVCGLWGKNKEETHTTTMPSDHQEQVVESKAMQMPQSVVLPLSRRTSKMR